jgi:hypothetical protein
MITLVTRHSDLVLASDELLADNRAADSLQAIQNKIESYAGLLHGFKIEVHSGLFNLVVQFAYQNSLLTL